MGIYFYNELILEGMGYLKTQRYFRSMSLYESLAGTSGTKYVGNSIYSGLVAEKCYVKFIQEE